MEKVMDKVNFSNEDKKYMRLAISLAEKARGLTGPNPVVGAVIVKDKKIIGTGYHKKAGANHAEIEAINACPDINLLKGATMYVSLEPCCIYGKTPPCTDSITGYGFGRLIAACIDPNPAVNGKGLKILKDSGIDVSCGLLEEIAEKQNEVFFKSVKAGCPFVTVKIASSLDGRTALGSGDSKWITSEKSRQLVQEIRYQNDCILTGINTVLEDDPLLYPRIKIKKSEIIKSSKRFVRAILDSNLRLGQDSQIAGTADKIKTIIFTDQLDSRQAKRAGSLQKMGLEIIQIKTVLQTPENGAVKLLDIPQALKILHDDYEVTSVLVEAGETVCSSLLTNKLIDKYLFFISPIIIGSDSSFGMFGSLKNHNLLRCPAVKFDSVRKSGNDMLITSYPE
jgi:diaminohydroxyphosphoribosylaminopyrimidine deaminase/5-amino-6-(5-phosphoribosylamino)uracil reductase